MWIQLQFFPPADPKKRDPAQVGDAKDKDKDEGKAKGKDEKDKGGKAEPKAPIDAPEKTTAKQSWATLGSLAAENNPFRFLVTFNSRGGTVQRIELAERLANDRFRYRDLEDSTSDWGYMGRFSPTDADDNGGCVLNVVGPGTPAATAGVQAGDILTKLDDKEISTVVDYWNALEEIRPGQEVTLQLRRGDEQINDIKVSLTSRPLEVLRSEPRDSLTFDDMDPLSLRLTLGKIEKGEFVEKFPEMTTDNWEVNIDDASEIPTIEFSYQPSAVDKEGNSIVDEVPPKIVKRFRLVPTPEDELGNGNFKSYHLEFDFEIINQSEEEQSWAYRLDGPTGLPTEGWWYINKIHPTSFAACGARDVAFRAEGTGHRLYGGPGIFDNELNAQEALADGDRSDFWSYRAENQLFHDRTERESRILEYLGCDTQYFAAVLLPGPDEDIDSLTFRQGDNTVVSRVSSKDAKKRRRTANISYQLESTVQEIPAKDSFKQTFLLFAGPKQPALLEEYGLTDLTSYGWFGMIARPLVGILHGFYWVIPNYGIAIILLTILVRAAMMPISRKAAKNAQMMQLLQPEIKKIAEKYKNDMQKRAVAQRELFDRYNYRPFGGCLLMFLQLPIFLGLYRGLSVDMALRDQPLIPGLDWCSNLAAPDRLWYWQETLPISFLTSETGFLGPYLNVLPLVTVVLFLVQQRMFTPKATDDQARMTQRIMTIMMIFIGFMFFKVPSGLCIYFITSSIWGVAERKLLPKPKTPDNLDDLPTSKKRSLLPKPDAGEKRDVAAERKAREAERRRKQRKK